MGRGWTEVLAGWTQDIPPTLDPNCASSCWGWVCVGGVRGSGGGDRVGAFALAEVVEGGGGGGGVLRRVGGLQSFSCDGEGRGRGSRARGVSHQVDTTHSVRAKTKGRRDVHHTDDHSLNFQTGR